MTNVVHKFLIHLSIFAALHVLGFLLAHSQMQVYKLKNSPVLVRVLTPYPTDPNHFRICTPASEDGLKRKPETRKSSPYNRPPNT
jgi:hypothetical protein